MAREPDMPPERGSRNRWWGFGVVIVVSAVTVGLISAGAKGSDVTGQLSFGLALLAYLAPQGVEKLWARITDTDNEEPDNQDPAPDQEPAPDRDPSWMQRFWGRVRNIAPIALGALVGVSVPAVLWYGIHKPDANVTDQVGVTAGRGMQNGSTAILSVPKNPDRDALSLTLMLTNSRGFGDCVVPATLRATPIIDGRTTDPVTLRSGKETRLPLGKIERQARVTLRLHEPDRSCNVDLGVAEAVLYNRGIL